MNKTRFKKIDEKVRNVIHERLGDPFIKRFFAHPESMEGLD
jgi:hypothetical protein